MAEIRRRYLAEFDTPAVRATVGSGYRVFADVVPTMRTLHAAGIRTAVISNADRDVTALCSHFEFAHEMDLIVTSALVGWEKPDIRTFQAAFEPLRIEPAAALHIGDQPRSDVVGARAAGMRAALIDRYARLDPANHEVPVVQDFAGLLAHVDDVNAAQFAGRG
jgi:putative hydrolase of the HAD superfamily